MHDTTTGPCPRCEELRADFMARRTLMAQLTDEARTERDECRTMLAATLQTSDELRATIARLRAQLRDEERENAALRRRLREGGR